MKCPSCEDGELILCDTCDVDKWISVKERLPDDCENVLIYCHILKSITGAYLLYDKDKRPICYVIVDFDEYEQTCSMDGITHWMPLPELPEF